MSELSFTAFVLSLASAAAVHFGDVPDETGKPADPNLTGAALFDLVDRKDPYLQQWTLSVEHTLRGNVFA